MNKSMKKITACALTAALALSMTFTGGSEASAAKKDKGKIKKITVTNVKKKKLKMMEGDSFKLKVKVKASPNKAKYKKVRFVSSKKKVATVSQKGKIKAKKAGKAKISVISRTNKKKKAVVQVTVASKRPPCGGAQGKLNTPVPSGTPAPSGKPGTKTEAPASGTPTATPTPTPTPSPEPDGTSRSVRRPFVQGVHVGDSLSGADIEGGSVIDSNGNDIEGTYSFEKPDTVMEKTGIVHQKVSFTPADSRFAGVKDIEITIPVSKAKVTISKLPYAGAITADQSLASSKLSGGEVKDEAGNVVPGSFVWTDAEAVPEKTGKCSVTFVPTDTEKYRRAATYIRVTVNGTPSASAPSDKKIDLSGGTWINKAAYENAWDGTVYDLTPYIEGLDMSLYEKVSLSVKLYDISEKPITSTGQGVAACKLSTKSNDWTGFASSWIDGNGSISLENFAGQELYLVVQNTSAAIGYIEITSLTLNVKGSSNIKDGSSLKAVFGDIFGKIGTAIADFEVTSQSTYNFIRSQFNGFTLGNEMKPERILGGSPTLSDSNPAGYVDTAKFVHPYLDKKYPKIDFDSIDNYIKRAYDNGLKMRYHVFVWHAQTPKWWFKENFSTSGSSAYVTPEVMDGRLEYMIRNVMTHIYNLKDENGVYIGRETIDSWDIANEYFHNYDKGYKSYWDEVYYPDYAFKKEKHSGILTPTYIKEAFALAHSILKDYGMEDSVSLLFNEFNTYMEADKIVTMINYFNTQDEINPEGEKICSGIGMQMHLDMGYPTVEGVRTGAIEKFRQAGFEIQITEFDLTDKVKSEETQKNQAQRWLDLMKMLIDEKDKGANITGVTWWGTSDPHSWRREGVPLLFSDYWKAKDHYFKAIQAAADYNEGYYD